MKVVSHLLFCALFLLFACNSDSTTNNGSAVGDHSSSDDKEYDDAVNNAAPINYKTLSSAYCKCAENTVSINAKLKGLMDSKNDEAFEAMLPEADKAYKEAMECCRDAKFRQTTGKVDQKKIDQTAESNLPGLAATTDVENGNRN